MKRKFIVFSGKDGHTGGLQIKVTLKEGALKRVFQVGNRAASDSSRRLLTKSRPDVAPEDQTNVWINVRQPGDDGICQESPRCIADSTAAEKR